MKLQECSKNDEIRGIILAQYCVTYDYLKFVYHFMTHYWAKKFL